jgi:hypothetical protein
MTTWLYATIWGAMTLFVAGAIADRRTSGPAPANWAWWIWLAGAVLCAVHMTIAMGAHYGWDHERAVHETAVRAATVYGFAWRGGLYVNYLFLLVWIGEIAWWTLSPQSYATRPAAIRHTLWIFYVIIVFNAVVVFATAPGRIAGVILTSLLIAAWWRDRR